MLKRVNRALRLSSAALVVAGYLALASVRGYAVVLVVPFVLLGLAPVGESLDRRFPSYRRMANSVAMFVCAVLVAWSTVDLLNSVIMLVVFIQTYTLLHRKEAQNYYHLYLMAFFLLLAACVLSPEPVIGLVLLLFLLSAIWAFLTLRLHEESKQAEERRAPDIVLLGAASPGPGEERKELFDTGLVVSVLLVSAAAVLLTALVFLFTPRMEAGFLGRNDSRLARTGVSQTVDLLGGTFVQQDPKVVMRVEFPEEPGGRLDGVGELYWRCTSLSQYYASQWQRRELSGHFEPDIAPLYPDASSAIWAEASAEVARLARRGARRVHQAVFVDDLPGQWLPCLDLVQQVRLQGGTREARIAWDRGLDFTVQVMQAASRRISYAAWSEVGEPAPDALRQASTDYRALRGRDYDVLTYQALRAETRRKIEEVVAGERSVYDKALAIQNWLSSAEFEYTLDLPVMPDRNAIDAFLVDIKRGHCEFFASGMALALRSLGVPARVVSGYRGGEWNEADHAYVVRASMAHLWVEVFFPGCGWVVFDPSPPDRDEDRSSIGRLTALISNYLLRAKIFWYQEVVGFDRSLQIERLRNLSVGLVRSLKGEGDFDHRLSLPEARPGWPLPWLVLLGLCLAALWLRWRGRKARQAVRLLTEDQVRAVGLYRYLCRRLARCGTPCQGKTAEELREELHGGAWIDAGRAIEALDTYNAVRFGLRPLAPGRYAELMKALRGLRPGLG